VEVQMKKWKSTEGKIYREEMISTRNETAEGS